MSMTQATVDKLIDFGGKAGIAGVLLIIVAVVVSLGGNKWLDHLIEQNVKSLELKIETEKASLEIQKSQQVMMAHTLQQIITVHTEQAEAVRGIYGVLQHIEGRGN